MIDILALICAELQAAGRSVYTDIPEGTPDPVTRVTWNGILSATSHMPDWSHEYDVEAQTWGTTRREAFEQVLAIWQHLAAHPVNEHGTITRVQIVGNVPEDDPDHPVDGQPGPRYITVFRLRAHP